MATNTVRGDAMAEARLQGRLRGTLAPEVAEEMMAGGQREQARHFHECCRVHRARTDMLAETGIVTRADAAAIWTALDEIEPGGVEGLGLSPLGDGLYLG